MANDYRTFWKFYFYSYFFFCGWVIVVNDEVVIDGKDGEKWEKWEAIREGR